MVEIKNKYETIFIVNPELGEEKINEIVEKFKSLISANGELTNVDVWGKKRLAYEINDLTEGYYVFIIGRLLSKLYVFRERKFIQINKICSI